jgi:hypothetical protein
MPDTNHIEAFVAEFQGRLKNLSDYTPSEPIYWCPSEAEIYWANEYDIDLYEYGPYPIVYQDDEEGIKVYTVLESGLVYTTFWGLGNAHFQGDSETDEIIHSTQDYALVMNSAANTVSCWSFGNELCKHDLPHEAVYVGFSDWVGYLFRAGTDVYALYDIGTCNFDKGEDPCGIKLIAENVMYVIDADYYASSDAWSQPLFHMTDGTVKVYCDWVEDPSNLESCLSGIGYEGGYDK